MNSVHSEAEAVRQLALDCGASVVRFARAEPVAQRARARYEDFLAAGRQGSMAWMERNRQVRDNPRLLLEGAKSLIVCLFNYHNEAVRKQGAPYVAEYALGRDYHKVLRQLLRPLVAQLQTGGHGARVCVDSAPLRERYWASRSGAAVVGMNNQLIVPGRGSAYFVAVVITTMELPPDMPLSPEAAEGEIGCERCGRCLKACPTGALKADGSCDVGRCLSYLTIEAPVGECPPDIDLGSTGIAFGCDACRKACPHSREERPTEIADFAPRKAILELDAEGWRGLSTEEYEQRFSGTPLRRASLERLRANVGEAYKDDM